MLAMCAGLLSRNGAGELTIPHASVIQYLEDHHGTIFSHKVGHAFIASICIQRLQMCESHPLSHLSVLDMYCASCWPSHLFEMHLCGSEDDFLSLPSQASAFSKCIDQFLTDSNSNTIVADAGTAISKCLEQHTIDHSPKNYNIRKWYEMNLDTMNDGRTCLAFCPDSLVGTLPIRIALNYKLKDLPTFTNEERIVPYKCHDLIWTCSVRRQSFVL